MARPYIPERGDVVWLEFDPQAGHEQAGRRVGLALFCPLTSRVKGYPFEVVLPPGLKATGAILADQIKSLDWRVRRARLLCRVPPEVVEETLARVLTLIETGPTR